MMANLLMALCKIDGKYEYEKRIGYCDDDWLTDEEIIELNPSDTVYDMVLKNWTRLGETEIYAQVVKRCSDKNEAMSEALHKWLSHENTVTV